MAVCELGLGRDNESLNLLREAEQITLDAGFVHNHQVALANIGNVYLHRRDYFIAISYHRPIAEHSLWRARSRIQSPSKNGPATPISPMRESKQG